MKCDRCNNEAIFEIHFIDNENKKTISLCRDCYFKYIDELMPNLNKNSDGLKYFQEAFTDIINNIAENIMNYDSKNEDKGEKKCSHCGTTLSQILEKGKIGCSQCYEDFKDEAIGLLNSTNKDTDNNKEISKIDEEINNIQSEIFKKKEELNELVNNEEYEKAASIRDEINILIDDIEKIDGEVNE